MSLKLQENRMSKTTDVSSITNSVMMAIDKEFRKNEVYTFPREHAAVRPIIHAMVAQIVADHIAEMVVEETRDERYVV